jgi:hypothetical protein
LSIWRLSCAVARRSGSAPETNCIGTASLFIKYRQKKEGTVEKFFVETDFGIIGYCRSRYLCASDI